mmetsp:Transcript_2473/g.3778  ORF Transcript_2473/g.3778 Transcript_2473/m.3778 type:complete len:330 (+) Transcript_2473:115-1104(+)
MSDHHENENAAKLNVMLHQEDAIYRCRDYFSSGCHEAIDPASELVSPPLCFAEECARLVSNLSIAGNAHTTSPKDVRSKIQHQQENIPSCVAAPKVGVAETHLIVWREQMCTWAYRVVETFGINRSIVANAFNFLDRYLSKKYLSDSPFTREEFQLLCMSALSLAAKTHGLTNKNISIFAMTDMSYGLFSVLDFEETELHLLDTLKWRLSPPIPCCFLMEFWKNWRGKPLTFQWVSRSRIILESSVADAYFVKHKPSQMALGAILVAGERIGILKADIDSFCTSIQNEVDVNDSRVGDIYDRLSAATQREKRLTGALYSNCNHLDIRPI